MSQRDRIGRYARLSWVVRLVLVVAAAMVPARAQAQPLVVSSVQPDTVNHQLVIQGGTFTAGLRVFLGPSFAELPVASLTSSVIHAALPDSPPGTDLLILYQPTTMIDRCWCCP